MTFYYYWSLRFFDLPKALKYVRYIMKSKELRTIEPCMTTNSMNDSFIDSGVSGVQICLYFWMQWKLFLKSFGIRKSRKVFLAAPVSTVKPHKNVILSSLLSWKNCHWFESFKQIVLLKSSILSSLEDWKSSQSWSVICSGYENASKL